MLGYDDMIERENEKQNTKLKLDKYKFFIEYIKKVIEITFKDEKDSIESYMKEIPDHSLSLDWSPYICSGFLCGVCISLLHESIYVSSLRSSYKYNDSVLNLTQNLTDEELLMFFEDGYGYPQYMPVFVPSYYIDDEYIDMYSSVVWKISDMLNRAIYERFIKHFRLLKIENYNSFVNSEYSLRFTDDRRRELDIEVRKYYDTYCKQVGEPSN